MVVNGNVIREKSLMFMKEKPKEELIDVILKQDKEIDELKNNSKT